MKLVLVLCTVVTLASVGIANVVLLRYGAGRADPVGRLSPVAHIAPPAAAPPTGTPRPRREPPDD